LRLRVATLALGALLAGAAARGQDPTDPAEILNALLGALVGFKDLSADELQREVADAGGVAFRSQVPLDYLSRDALAAYLEELLDSEYPPERAAAEQRTLVAFDLLAPDTDLRGLRAKLLRENIAGFYDERPSRRRLYAVSEDRRLTPANQIILAHELRHALQDQYADVGSLLSKDVGDFDDRRMALMSLLEGDATLVMERFLLRRLSFGGGDEQDLSAFSMPAPPVPGAPPVLRDQLMLPYLAGRDFALAIFRERGWDGIKAAWLQPPASTEQVLHPDKFLAREPPQQLELPYAPRGGRLLAEGVLGELLTRTLLGETIGHDAAAGWGGDLYRAWDVSGRTLLVWRSSWDTPADAAQFSSALEARYRGSHGAGHAVQGSIVHDRGPWRVALRDGGSQVTLVASDDADALAAALRSLR
jgi:hypothetical protein